MNDLKTPFVLLAREGQNRILSLTGSVETPADIAGLAARWDDHPQSTTTDQIGAFFLLPYNQICERGFKVRFSDTPILMLKPEQAETFSRADLLSRLPDESETLITGSTAFDIPDEVYCEQVRRIIQDEIAEGEGANFVIARSCEGKIAEFTLRKVLKIYRNLLEKEFGAYWVYLFWTGESFIIGATPERHLSVYGDEVLMNPISGTFRKRDYTPETARKGLLEFLRNPKEMYELFMVVDEELKMMSQICSEGGQILGPHLKEMSRLVHTEYLLAGRSSLSVEDMLRLSMFAPTVTGSPIENAARIIAKYETRSRRYYSGIAGLRGISENGTPFLDSSIIIRTAEIFPDGCFRLTGGATLVRDSDPVAETAETVAKISGMLSAITGKGSPTYIMGNLRRDKEIQSILQQRNETLSQFWFQRQPPHIGSIPNTLKRRKVAIMDNEDSFTEMQVHILSRFGVRAKVISWKDFDLSKLTSDAIPVIGPGPGDPSNLADPKIAKIHHIVRTLLDSKRRFAAVCLGHQVTALEIGLKIVKKQNPSQGIQIEVETPHGKQRVGFYNTFTAVEPLQPVSYQYFSDHETREIHTLIHPLFKSVQYHPESILTENGALLFTSLLE